MAPPHGAVASSRSFIQSDAMPPSMIGAARQTSRCLPVLPSLNIVDLTERWPRGPIRNRQANEFRIGDTDEVLDSTVYLYSVRLFGPHLSTGDPSGGRTQRPCRGFSQEDGSRSTLLPLKLMSVARKACKPLLPRQRGLCEARTRIECRAQALLAMSSRFSLNSPAKGQGGC